MLTVDGSQQGMINALLDNLLLFGNEMEQIWLITPSTTYIRPAAAELPDLDYDDIDRIVHSIDSDAISRDLSTIAPVRRVLVEVQGWIASIYPARYPTLTAYICIIAENVVKLSPIFLGSEVKKLILQLQPYLDPL